MQYKTIDNQNERETMMHNNITLESKPFLFQANFEGSMDMYSDAETVSEYLNAHEGWFCRCAEPMKVEPLGNNGYILVIGRFKSLGYEVEPKIAVVLEPPVERVYHTRTIPIPGYNPPGYDVDYKASMELLEVPTESAASEIIAACRQQKKCLSLPPVITKVTWKLSLTVAVEFPKFIYKLPVSLIQTTGDRLLAQIIRQVSPRLTSKVQKDFHSRFDLPIPPKSARDCYQVARSPESEKLVVG